MYSDMVSGIDNKVCVVLGAQWGDEGKGKIVDMIASDVDLVCRCQGGNNAGHTVVADGVMYDFHLLPSGMVNSKAMNLIGNGVVVNLPLLFEEAEDNAKRSEIMKDWQKRLLISDRAHLGTTKRGIGPCYSSKATRSGIRLCDLVNLDKPEVFRERLGTLRQQFLTSYPGLVLKDFEDQLAEYAALAKETRPMAIDTVGYLHRSLNEGKRVLVEGANATLLDIDFGLYPYVTSSNCSIGGVCTGLGLPTSRVGEIIGVVKAYTSRVGVGHIPTWQDNAIGDQLIDIGHEYGVTTKRRRRCGWLDMVAVRFSHSINGFTKIAVTKLDILDTFTEIKIGIGYSQNGIPLPADGYPASNEQMEATEVEYKTFPGWNCDTTKIRAWGDLPPLAKDYVTFIGKFLGVPIAWVGVGQDREAILKVPLAEGL